MGVRGDGDWGAGMEVIADCAFCGMVGHGGVWAESVYEEGGDLGMEALPFTLWGQLADVTVDPIKLDSMVLTPG